MGKLSAPVVAYSPIWISVRLVIGRINKSYLSEVLVSVMKKEYVFYEAGTKIVLWSMFFKTYEGNAVLKPGIYFLKAVSLSGHKFSSFEWLSFHED
jgi:hypothetical protein